MASIDYFGLAANPRVKQFLDTIGAAEDTDKHGYYTAFGGGRLESLADHPRTLHSFTQTDGRVNKTSAAGRYQFIRPTWDEAAKALDLKDFSPANQDAAAVWLLERNGALPAILEGDFDTAIKKSGPTWASLPSSPYAQPKRSPGFIAQALDRAAQAVFPPAQASEAPRMTAWKDVIAKPEFQALTPEQQAAARQQYFQQVVAPRVPEGQLEAAQAQFEKQYGGAPKPEVSDSALVGFGAGLGKGVGTVALNAQRYLGKGINAVSDFISPPEQNVSGLVTGQPQGGNAAGNWLVQDAEQGLKKLEGEVAPYKQASPFSTGAGELGGNIAATLPVGGVLARGVGAALPASQTTASLANALRSGGMNLGAPAATTALGRAGNAALRVAGGAGTGAASASLVNPEDTGLGAIVGGAFPLAAGAAARGGAALGNALRGGSEGASDAVRNLAARAKELGIDIPADRLVNSRPLNAVASSLNYVPLSGRAATEDAMQTQLNRALSRTFGQDSSNVTQALRNASDDLGAKFDKVLQNTVVRVDDDFLNAMARRSEEAIQELPGPLAQVINNQIDDVINKASANNGQLSGELAYNFKRTLDRIAKRNTPEGYYANELKKDLMEALNRSLGPDEAQAFAKTRQQYGNMLSLENLAKNGADGEISVARLANMRNIRNPELQELADISAQFLRPREGQHGAAQRIMAGALVGSTAGVPAVLGGMTAGRMANALLNSNTMRDAMLGNTAPNSALANALRQALPVTARALPVISAQ